MITFDDRNEVTIQNPPAGKAILFYDEDVLKLKDENGDIRIVTLADSIENAVSSGDYYSNSYVERLKALGSDTLYSTTFGGQSAFNAINDGIIHLTSIYIPKTSIITGVSFGQTTQGVYTADNYNGIGLYSFDKNTKNLTLVGSTSNDGDIWKAGVASVASKDFSTPINIEKGVYYIAALLNYSATSTTPVLTSNGSVIVSSGISATNFKLPSNVYFHATVGATNNTLPATILSTDMTTSSISYIYWLY